jgi:tetratricopeptide (TPR) repeat protein
MNTTKQVLVAIALAGLAACGGTQTGGGTLAGGGGDVPPPPPGSPDQQKEPPKVVVSADARSDFERASAFFADQEKGKSWSQSACSQSAENFRAVASEHKTLIDAHYMVGLSFHKCGMIKEAESAYQATLRVNPNHAQSLSNLGWIYYNAGKVDGARQYWTRAVQAYQKVTAARIGLAQLILDDMRRTTDNARWSALDKEAANHLSSVLAVDNDSIQAYYLYAMVFMEGRRKNKNRLDLAKLLMDEGEKRNAAYAPLKNARGLLFYHRNNLGSALKLFQEAVKLDPNLVEARLNVGLTTLGFRNYPVAKEQFEKVLELQSKNYDAVIGLGIALRGLGDLEGAEKQYNIAKQIDGRRGDAAFNLGVLYKDFKATKVDTLEESQKLWLEAKKHFQDFLTKADISNDDKAEAKNNIEDCDKLVKQVNDFRRMEKEQAEKQAKMDAEFKKQEEEFKKAEAEAKRLEEERLAKEKAAGGGGAPAPAPAPKK